MLHHFATQFLHFWCASSSTFFCPTWRAWSTRHWLKVDYRLHRNMLSWRHFLRRRVLTLLTWPSFESFLHVESGRTGRCQSAVRQQQQQQQQYLSANNLLCFQSAYRKRHSTETTILRVLSDMLMAADVRQVTLLGMLDLSAAFDCVDHTILLQRLQIGFSLTDVALKWIVSFMTERTQQIAYNIVQYVLFRPGFFKEMLELHKPPSLGSPSPPLPFHPPPLPSPSPPLPLPPLSLPLPSP